MMNGTFIINDSLNADELQSELAKRIAKALSIADLAQNEIFPEDCSPDKVYYVFALHDLIVDIHELFQALMPDTMHLLLDAPKRKRAYKLNHRLPLDTLSYALIDRVYQAESMLTIGAKHVFLETVSGEKTNIMFVLARLLVEIRELLEFAQCKHPLVFTGMQSSLSTSGQVDKATAAETDFSSAS